MMLRFPLVPFDPPAPPPSDPPSDTPPSPPLPPPTQQPRMLRGWTSLKRRLGRSPVLSEPSSEGTLQTAHTTITSSDDKVATWMKVQEDGFSQYSSSIYSQEESQSPDGSPGKTSMQRPLSPVAPLFSSSPSGKSPVCCFSIPFSNLLVTNPLDIQGCWIVY